MFKAWLNPVLAGFFDSGGDNLYEFKRPALMALQEHLAMDKEPV